MASIVLSAVMEATHCWAQPGEFVARMESGSRSSSPSVTNPKEDIPLIDSLLWSNISMKSIRNYM